MATAAPPPPMALSTANWHWKNKNVTPWVKTWITSEAGAVSVRSDAGEVSVSVESVEGDAELGQRKSKCVVATATQSCASGMWEN
jgi:activator of HSP90 ATPase